MVKERREKTWRFFNDNGVWCGWKLEGGRSMVYIFYFKKY